MKTINFKEEFNDRVREKTWIKSEIKFKKMLRLKLKMVKFVDSLDESEIPEKFFSQEFWRLNLGYNGIGRDVSSGIRSEATLGLKSNQIVHDHLFGATEIGKHIHQVLKDSDYDIDWMVEEWLYENLFIFGTIKITKEEHQKDNVLRNSSHTIEEKLNFKHYIKVSKLI